MTWVYEAYDADMKPVYVGCTYHVLRRMDAHKTAKVWYDRARWWTLAMFRDHRDGLRYERDRIDQLRPPYNNRGNPDFNVNS